MSKPTTVDYEYLFLPEGITFGLSYYGERFRNRALSMQLVKSMTGLRTLRLNIVYGMEERFGHAAKEKSL